MKLKQQQEPKSQDQIQQQNNIQNYLYSKKKTKNDQKVIQIKKYIKNQSLHVIKNKEQQIKKSLHNSLMNQKLYNKILYFQNNSQFKNISNLKNKKVEAFFNDGSCFNWENQTIIYVSQKGIKTRLHLQDVYRSQDLLIKLFQTLFQLNKYHQNYFQFQQKLNKKIQQILNSNFKKNQLIYKKYRIKQYNWEKAPINKTQEGYEIISNDQNAKLILMNDLFRIRVEYLQISANKRKVTSHVQNQYELKEFNQFDKYVFHAPVRQIKQTKYKTRKDQKDQISYGYYKVIKYFSIFNLPSIWYCPIDQLWTYLLANKLIKHEFMYIDFHEQGISYEKTTQMPTPIELGKKNNQQNNQEEFGLANNYMPLYGRPNHLYKCKWMSLIQFDKNQQQNNKLISWFNSESDQNLFYDGFGFWLKSNSDNYFYYKILNCNENFAKYYCNTIPMIIRHQNQPQRKLQTTLNVISSYIVHNQKVNSFEIQKKMKSAQQSSKINPNSNQLVFQENLHQIGTFKVYANGMIIGKFVDKTIFTLKGQTISGIDFEGQHFLLDINKIQRYSDVNLTKNTKNLYAIYREHINCIKDLYEKVFYYDQWIKKNELNQKLNNLKIANQAYMSVCERYKKF